MDRGKHIYICSSYHVCVFVRERERESQRGSESFNPPCIQVGLSFQGDDDAEAFMGLRRL